MAAFYFRCDACGAKARKLFQVAPTTFPCKCGQPMTRDHVAPTNRSTEVLDNGAMTRPLERLDNAEEIFRDRARQERTDE